MSAPHADQIIDGYMARLKQAVYESGVSADRGREIVEDIARHIAEARRGFSDESDADLLNLIERLGDPAAIVADEGAHDPANRPAVSAPPRPLTVGLLEIAAIVLTVFFWPVGLALAVISPAWTRRDKQVLGILLVSTWVVALLILPIIGAAFAGVGVGHLSILVFFLGLFVTPALAAIYLAVCLARRRSMMTA